MVHLVNSCQKVEKSVGEEGGGGGEEEKRKDLGKTRICLTHLIMYPRGSRSSHVFQVCCWGGGGGGKEGGGRGGGRGRLTRNGA